MIVILKKDTSKEHIERLSQWLARYDLRVHHTAGEKQSILGLIGDTSRLDIDLLRAMDMVEDVKRIQEPYKNANRKFHPEDTVVEAGGAKLGGSHFGMIAGPCSVESEAQIVAIAKAVKAAGANMLRGGAFKPRSSPYSFQGLRERGIELLLLAKKATGLPIVTEIMDIHQLPCFEEVDVIQVGARNMQNFELLKELGTLNKPILLKRGFANTYEEWLMSAEYITSGGNEQVILCERGIRSFEPQTRNTLDLCAIPVLKSLTHFPIIVDPSHATGAARLVRPMALAAAAGGADGLIIEVHNDPPHALCDGAQSITPEAFSELKKSVDAVLLAIGDEKRIDPWNALA